MRPLKRKVRQPLLAACAVLALVVPASPLSAQETPEPEAAAPEPPPELKLADILRGASEDQALIRKIQEGAEAQGPIEKLGAELPQLEVELAGRIADADNQLEVAQRVRVLREIEERWLREQASVERSRTQVSSRALELQGSLEVLIETRKRWTAALEEALSLEAPAGLIAQIEETIVRIEAARAGVDSRWAQVLDIEARLGSQITQIIEVAARAKRASDEARLQLLQSENLPIWAALREYGEIASLRRRSGDELAADFAAAREYAELHRMTLAWQGLLVLGAVALFLALRSTAMRIASAAADAEIATALFNRPYAAGAVLGLQLASLAHPTAPEGFQAIQGMIVVVPFLRLVPVIFPAAQGLVFGLVGFYLIDRLRMVLVDLPLVERIVFDAEMLLVISGMLWLLLPGRLERMVQPGRFVGSAVVWVLRLWLPLVVFALGASAVGYDDLGHVIGEAVLRTSYAAMMYTALYRILTGVIPVALRTRLALRANVVRRHRPLLTQRLVGALGITGFAMWLWDGLGYFTIRDWIVARVQQTLESGVSIGTLSMTVGDVAALVAAVVAAVYLSRLIRFVLEEEALPRLNLARGVPRAISVTSGYVVLLLGMLVALAAGGIDLGRISLVAGAFSVGIGFGLQGVVNNFVSGLILMFERPIQLQDTIQVDQLLGVVQRIGIRSSTVRTFQGAEVIVPNALLVSDQVVNWTLSDKRRRIDLPVGVSYDADLDKVIQVLQEVARRESRLLEDPEPAVIFTEFGESGVRFELRVWIGAGDWIAVRSDLGVSVRRALKDAGIRIAYPQRDLHLRTTPRTEPQEEDET